MLSGKDTIKDNRRWTPTTICFTTLCWNLSARSSTPKVSHRATLFSRPSLRLRLVALIPRLIERGQQPSIDPHQSLYHFTHCWDHSAGFILKTFLRRTWKPEPRRQAALKLIYWTKKIFSALLSEHCETNKSTRCFPPPLSSTGKSFSE